jgi:hypothetical protein
MNPAHSLLLLLKWGKRGDQTQLVRKIRGKIRINTTTKPKVLSYGLGACQQAAAAFFSFFKKYSTVYFILKWHRTKEAWIPITIHSTTYSRYKFVIVRYQIVITVLIPELR